MIFLLYEYLKEIFTPFNVVRYVSFRIMAAFVTSLLICLVLYPWFIRKLQQQSIGQEIRDDGPKSHLVKKGTPTMGGALIIISILFSTLLWTDIRNVFIWMLLGITVFFGIVGFIDDYRKLMNRSSKGLSGKKKLALQFISAAAVMAVFFVVFRDDVHFNTRLYIPFLRIDKFWFDIPLWVYVMAACVIIVGTSNAVNLTDGLDGLASGPIIIASGTFLILCYLTGAKLGTFDISKYLLIPKVVGVQEVSIFCSAIMGSTIAFLWFNAHPAEIFMGDTGALSLGASLGAIAVFTKNELLSLIIFGIFFVEAVSVIIQTLYFKLTRRRIFLMSPLHHTFELIGWSEPKIVTRAWIIQILLSLVAIASIKVR
ncbi:MAG: phospho-N-acetylmuramoyl-pentapeptide-transferase [Deltaproteobacteria bacterium]|nr:phospho-N-acetylmuramoyl-pentapeptide-transferase [Deltaproteobacteria bacterium]